MVMTKNGSPKKNDIIQKSVKNQMALKLKAANQTQYKSQSLLVPSIPTHTRHKSIQLNLNLSDSSEERLKQAHGEIIQEENEDKSGELKVHDEFPQTDMQAPRIQSYTSNPKNFIYKNITSLQKQSSGTSERRLITSNYMKGRLSMSGLQAMNALNSAKIDQRTSSSRLKIVLNLPDTTQGIDPLNDASVSNTARSRQNKQQNSLSKHLLPTVSSLIRQRSV